MEEFPCANLIRRIMNCTPASDCATLYSSTRLYSSPRRSGFGDWKRGQDARDNEAWRGIASVHGQMVRMEPVRPSEMMRRTDIAGAICLRRWFFRTGPLAGRWRFDAM